MGASMGSGGGGEGRRRRRRRSGASDGMMSEINVTPFVDVMLVLLIVFMVAAPLLSVGVPVNLPETEAETLPAPTGDPVSITVGRDGAIFLGEEELATAAELPARLEALGVDAAEDIIYIRGDLASRYGAVYSVMGVLADAGYLQFGLVGEPEQ